MAMLRCKPKAFALKECYLYCMYFLKSSQQQGWCKSCNHIYISTAFKVSPLLVFIRNGFFRITEVKKNTHRIMGSGKLLNNIYKDMSNVYKIHKPNNYICTRAGGAKTCI